MTTDTARTVMLLNELAEFLDGQSDVVDGSYGEPQPNRAMTLLQEVDREIERLSAAPQPSTAAKTPAPSNEGVGRGDAAVAALPTATQREGSHSV